jgi:tetratricopeptide (TPR) repeat protein
VPEYQRELAGAHHALGNLLRSLGERDAARAEDRQARDLQQRLAAAFPTVPQYQQNLAMTYTSLGILLRGMGERDSARTEYAKARDLQQKLVAAFPAVPDYQQELANTHNNLGILLPEMGQWEAARAEYKTAADLRQKLATAFPSVLDYQRELSTIHNNVGTLLRGMGERDAARTQYENARDLQQKLATAFPAVPLYQQELARTQNNLGNLLSDLGQHDLARAEHEKALDLRKKLAAAFPAVSEYRAEVGGSYCGMGTLVLNEGQPADCLHWFDLAIRTLTPVYENDRRAVRVRQYLRDSYEGQAKAYDRLRKLGEADKSWENVIELTVEQDQPHFRASQAKSRLVSGQTAGAMAEVEELTKSAKARALHGYNFACVYSLASAKIADKKEEYADRAMELLRQAMNHWCKDANYIKRDADLDPLRGRADFKRLVAELEARAMHPENPGP